MHIKLILNGKTDEAYLCEGISIFEKRLKHYCSFEQIILPSIKAGGLNAEQIKEKEAELIYKQIKHTDYVILLDEKGKQLTSIEFAEFISKQQLESVKTLVFIVGGPFGFSKSIYNRANYLLSLSKMTFSHQMIRLLFIEQLYRAFTIIKGEKYHHE
jgi:23S rRNA (pseudouridine1915-N3)-methyltransferase